MANIGKKHINYGGIFMETVIEQVNQINQIREEFANDPNKKKGMGRAN
jgi:hypothetical protein